VVVFSGGCVFRLRMRRYLGLAVEVCQPRTSKNHLRFPRPPPTFTAGSWTSILLLLLLFPRFLPSLPTYITDRHHHKRDSIFFLVSQKM